MRIEVNGVRLWFDTDGPVLVPAGREMRARPTVVLVHGGPASYDHSYFKPDFCRLAEHAQLIYLDLRGHGRSEWGEPEAWTMEACADDIRAFCDAVGIERPIVLGHSMGVPVVLLYGARHAGHPAGLVAQSGFARWDLGRIVDGFRRFGGDEVAEIAARSYGGGTVTAEEWNRVYAVFGPRVPGADELARRKQNPSLRRRGSDVLGRTDIVDQLARIRCPTLVSVGELDPVTPLTAAEEIAAALPAGFARLVVLPNAGHFPWKDVPDRYWPLLGEFVDAVARDYLSQR